MPLSSEPEVEVFLAEHADWARSGDEIRRTFSFGDFSESLSFVVRVAMEAEKANHHPDIDIRWNKVTLTLSTHSEGGLTAKDLSLARTLDDLA